MPSVDLRKRKACQNCTKAKAKCSPSENGLDICYRCQRLKKECIFEAATKQRAPKSRSRVKQLEQRVDTLIDLLAINGQSTNAVPVSSASSDHAIRSTETRHASTTHTTPVETPENDSTDMKASKSYDPIEAGHVDARAAATLLDEFKSSFVWSFPFVILPASMDVDTLRQCQPFLFHAVMTVMTYSTPRMQRAISEEFKKQIANRIIGKSDKSLEILQGLLVYATWYHYFYKPQNQHISIIIQLCVAMIQDLGLSKNPKDRARKLTLTEDQCGLTFKADRSTAEKRAVLGAYYLAVAFAQAWRMRSTIAHTKYMAQCYQSLKDHPEQPTDALIAPLIRLSDLTCRVSDFFSYDDVENSDSKGEMMLEISASNFRSELVRIKENIPESLKQNTTLNLKLTLLEIWIHEVSLHGLLWTSSPAESVSAFPPFRYKMLYRSLIGMKTYLKTLIEIPDPALYYLGFPSWAGWFYATIVACKLVFLNDNERQGRALMDGIQGELDSLLPAHFLPGASHEYYALPQEDNNHSSWDPGWVAKEAEVQVLFVELANKLKFTVPSDGNFTPAERGDLDPLFGITCLQHGFLHGFNKRSKEYMSKAGPQDSNYNSVPHADIRRSGESASDTRTSQPIDPSQVASNGINSTDYARERMELHPVPFIESMNFNSLNFDSIQKPDSLLTQKDPFDEWMWDLMMDDFTLPPF